MVRVTAMVSSRIRGKLRLRVRFTTSLRYSKCLVRKEPRPCHPARVRSMIMGSNPSKVLTNTQCWFVGGAQPRQHGGVGLGKARGRVEGVIGQGVEARL